MSNFFRLFLFAGGRAPVAIVERLAQAASDLSDLANRWRLRGRRGEGPAPPIFLGDNHLRRDIGLPPVDRHGRPI
jgi:hypothetical protein